MKNNKKFKNSIISFLLIGVILAPYFGNIPRANAQSNSSYSFQSSGINGGVQGYMKMVTPMIPKLQGCKQVLKNGIGKGVSAIKNLFSSGSDLSGVTFDANSVFERDLAEAGSDASTVVESVQTNDKTLNKTNETTLHRITHLSATTDTVTSNELCLNSVGKLIAKILVRYLTDSTVKWINSGNFGESFWPKNKGDLFNNLRQTEILKFMGEIDNPTLYPFAKSFMQNQVKALNTHFAQNAQYSMNQMIQDTTPEYSQETFSKDFSKGGWNAWSALTQVPANNPIGFNISASKELQERLAGTTQSPAQDIRDSLKEAGGFLGQEQCTDPSSKITRESERQALKDGNPYNKETSDIMYDQWNYMNICKKWEYVTPGGMIAKAATGLTNYQKDSLLSVEDLNGAIAAVLDAAISKWGGELMGQGGLASLSPVDHNNQYDLSNNGSDGPTQVEQDFPGSSSTGWLNDNPDFNIRSDITQALVDQQRTYITKLENYTKELGILNRTIYQLDYCIPGPHPGWEQDSADNLQTITDSMQSGVRPLAHGIGVSILEALPIVGGIIGAYNNYTGGINASNDMDTLLLYYSGMSGAGIGDAEDASSFLNGMFNYYVQRINKYYRDASKMPFAWSESIQKFNQVPGYKQIIEDNTAEIIFRKEIVKKLQTLKEGIDNNNTYTDFSPTSFPIKQFARLSPNLVSGSDVANIDSLYTQANEERNYVWNDLLKGPNGCEQDLVKNWQPLNWRLNYLQRPTYPFPILYDYNNYNRGDILPNNPVPAIPGVTFDSTSNYQNTNAFVKYNQWGITTHTFLNDLLVIASDNLFSVPFIALYTGGGAEMPIACIAVYQTGCGDGHYSLSTYTVDPATGFYVDKGVAIFESRALQIY